MEDEIKVGEFVRNKEGKIIKVYWVGHSIVIDDNGLTFLKNDIVKHSFNIIDLIEKDDYVNGSRVLDKYLFAGKELVLETNGEDTNCKCLMNKDIKSILTKEMFEANVYKLEEK